MIKNNICLEGVSKQNIPFFISCALKLHSSPKRLQEALMCMYLFTVPGVLFFRFKDFQPNDSDLLTPEVNVLNIKIY